MKLRVAIAAILTVFILAPVAPARADVVLTPYVGTLFGGDVGNTPGHQVSYGGSAAFMGGGIFGVELGFNYTPEFIQDTIATPDIRHASLMGNLIVGIPMGNADQGGQLRPYVTGGAGLFRTSASNSALFGDGFSSNDFGVNFGGGLMAFFSEHVGVRADVRYFRKVSDNDPGGGVDFDLTDLDFWKWDVGAAFRF
jgi:opacity protein-like surface antigen